MCKWPLQKLYVIEIMVNFQISNASNFVQRLFREKNPREKTNISARCARRDKEPEKQKPEGRTFSIKYPFFVKICRRVAAAAYILRFG